ncbi:DUF6515 family protein [Paraferrimonas haliotis]|uniref:Uncharacterized protein n=1 Tax=Paraferrimonas haliotis TaxID=2013866 RepID=A0AA37TQP4_9GAMM|nr:DUF6515 family protein [Paraferrimonas haliotis]GLS83670.1 hypothetical protein GCM10007894_16470 [Paraferrimonas haliotis]
MIQRLSALVLTLFMAVAANALYVGDAFAKAKSPKVVKHLPKGHVHLHHRGHRYWYYQGYYYRPYRSSYQIVSAPLGVEVKVLPVGYTKWVVGGVEYYQFADQYYRFNRKKQAYVVVKRPRGLPAS